MRWSLLVVALLVPVVSGCAMNPRAGHALATPASYLLDTGDVVRLTVYGDTTLSTTYTVTDAGTINVPLIGSVVARGQAISSIEGRVTKLLANGYMIDPKVSAEIATYRPFFIEGAVTTAGQFPYVWGMTARSAVAVAGGFKDFADKGRVTLYRKIGGVSTKLSVPLEAPILPGDTIVVGERWL